MSKDTRLVQRFQRSIRLQDTLRSADAKNQRTTKTRQIRAEASQALPAPGANYSDTDAVISSASNQAVSNNSAAVQRSSKYLSKTKEPYTFAELDIRLSNEKDLNKGYQTELEDANARIKDLERKLSDAEARLKESIVNDQTEELSKQRRIIKHLQEQLEEVETERDRARERFRDSESKVWDLERELWSSRHYQRLAACHHDHTDGGDSCIDSVPEVRQKGKLAARKNVSKIARRRGDAVLYLMT